MTIEIKKEITKVNGFIRSSGLFSNNDLANKRKSFEDDLRKIVLVENTISSNNGSTIFIRLAKTEKEINNFITGNNTRLQFSSLLGTTTIFNEEMKSSFLDFLANAARSRSEITDKSYVDWLQRELEQTEPEHINAEEISMLVVQFPRLVLQILGLDIIIEALSTEEMATIALNALVKNASVIDSDTMKSLMQYMVIDDEENPADPIDFIATKLDEKFDKFKLQLARNVNLKLGSLDKAQNLLVSINDEIIAATGRSSSMDSTDPDYNPDSSDSDESIGRNTNRRDADDDSIFPEAKRHCGEKVEQNV
ncbi:MAG UNVERIFIED_CONTAM: hypothetical protein LVQ98_01175 [Rickettsiaceae bacterium]|jgi:hypothetical protein